jgi:tellurite resistance protein
MSDRKRVSVSGAVAIITALTGFVVALTGLVGAIFAGLKLLRKEPKDAAKNAATLAIEAAADGEISAEELKAISEAKDHKP